MEKAISSKIIKMKVGLKTNLKIFALQIIFILKIQHSIINNIDSNGNYNALLKFHPHNEVKRNQLKMMWELCVSFVKKLRDKCNTIFKTYIFFR